VGPPPLIFVIVFVLWVLGVFGGGGGGETETVNRYSPKLPLEQQGELAQRFRPVLLFDSDERWRPLDAERFFGDVAQGEALQVCDLEPGPCDDVSDVNQFEELVAHSSGLGQGAYLDIPGHLPNGDDYVTSDKGCLPPGSALLDCNKGRDSVIYYNVRPANGRYYVDYWWFFRYNDFPRIAGVNPTSCVTGPLHNTAACDDHESDWEGITVVTPISDPTQIQYVAYAAHTGTYRYLPGQLDLRGEDHTRPAVFVANGSHASYTHPCDNRVLCQQHGTLSLPDGRYDGAVPWGRNSGNACNGTATPCLLHLPNELVHGSVSWDGYRGRWGKSCASRNESCPLAQGPLSPSQQPRYRDPWCSTVALPEGNKVEAKPSCDAEIADASVGEVAGLGTDADCLAWLGTGVAALACDRDTLAQGLATADALHVSHLHLTRYRRAPGVEPQAAPASTPGIAQLQGSPLVPGQRLEASGPISDLTIRYTGSRSGTRRQIPAFESEFHNLGLRPRQTAVAEVHDRLDRPPKLTVRLQPSGKTLQGVVHQLRAVEPARGG
jgi:hypothetical protein